MDLLEYYHNVLPVADHFVPRKCTLPPKTDINLYGVRGSGKSTIAIDYLSQIERQNVLYIDYEDPNLIFHALDTRTIQHYIDTHAIDILVLDHYEAKKLSSFPNVLQLIVITRIPLKNHTLKPIELFPLDYEEFLAFEGVAAQSKGLNHFLRAGTLPQLARSQKMHLLTMKMFYQSSFQPQEQKLLLLLAQHHTQHLTTHQIYTYAKEKFKVSKDWIYTTIKLFTQEKLLIFINDRHQKSGKKMLLFDFAFAKYLTLGQPFIVQFDTMVALAFIKHHIPIDTLGIHGYITHNNELIIPAPFESEESLWVKSQTKFNLYKKYAIKKVTIVTITNTYAYTIEKLHFEAIPFNEWSIINNEISEEFYP